MCDSLCFVRGLRYKTLQVMNISILNTSEIHFILSSKERRLYRGPWASNLEMLLWLAWFFFGMVASQTVEQGN